MASGVQAACDAISSALVGFESYLFLASGDYKADDSFSAYSGTITQNIELIGHDCGYLNVVQSSDSFSYLATMMESLGNFFESISQYQNDIKQRDSDTIVMDALSEFVDDAWSMVVTISETVTDCDFLGSQDSAAQYLQSCFFSIGQINPESETFYQTIELSCGASNSLSVMDADPGQTAQATRVVATSESSASASTSDSSSSDSSFTFSSSSSEEINTYLGGVRQTAAPSSSAGSPTANNSTSTSTSTHPASTTIVSMATFGVVATTWTANGAGLIGASFMSGLLFLLV